MQALLPPTAAGRSGAPNRTRRVRTGFAALAAAAAIAGGVAGAAAEENLLERGERLLRGLQGAGQGAGARGSSLTTAEIASGLKEALRIGAERVVGVLGRADGFYRAADVHIPLPGALASVQRALDRVGMSSLTDDLELRLNRAAEAAVPRAKKLFGDAIKAMTLDDARGILEGPNDSATRYFQQKMTDPLLKSLRPVVKDELAKAGAVRAYDNVMGQYRSLPFVPDAKADLTDYALRKTLDGVFLYLGREEAAIRENPAKRTTALLRKVFGSGG
jgi:hypothetical protein